MKSPTMLTIAAHLLVLAAFGTAPSNAAVQVVADTIYVGGDIVTINDVQPTAEALAVKGGRILAVGARADVESAHKGDATKIVDLAGKTLLPGFLDSHSHYVSALSVANQAKVYAPPAGPGADVPSIIAAIEKFRMERGIPKAK